MDGPWLARVDKVLGRTGSQGQCTQISVTTMGPVVRVLLRNVKGPIRPGDTISLSEIDREARKLK